MTYEIKIKSFNNSTYEIIIKLELTCVSWVTKIGNFLDQNTNGQPSVRALELQKEMSKRKYDGCRSCQCCHYSKTCLYQMDSIKLKNMVTKEEFQKGTFYAI